MPTTIYRVQDKHGRGPWKPGFSQKWVEDRPDHDNLKPYCLEFPDFAMAILRAGLDRMIVACGCRTVDQLKRWFTKGEYNTLFQYGYRAVKAPVDEIIVESDIQCVFARKKRLHKNIKPIRLY